MSDMSEQKESNENIYLTVPFYRWANCGQKNDVCLRTSTEPEMALDEVFHWHFSSQMFICWWCPIEVVLSWGKIKICAWNHMGNPVLHTQPSFLPVDMLWSREKIDYMSFQTYQRISLQNLPFEKLRKSLRAYTTASWFYVYWLTTKTNAFHSLALVFPFLFGNEHKTATCLIFWWELIFINAF